MRTARSIGQTLDSAYRTCADGDAQAPIDIVNPSPADLANPEFRYRAADAPVINNGHTVQANAGPGSAIDVGQVEFRAGPGPDGDPVLLSAAQIAAFEAAYHRNRRPIQPLNDRPIEIDSTP